MICLCLFLSLSLSHTHTHTPNQAQKCILKSPGFDSLPHTYIPVYKSASPTDWQHTKPNEGEKIWLCSFFVSVVMAGRKRRIGCWHSSTLHSSTWHCQQLCLAPSCRCSQKAFDLGGHGLWLCFGCAGAWQHQAVQMARCWSSGREQLVGPALRLTSPWTRWAMPGKAETCSKWSGRSQMTPERSTNGMQGISLSLDEVVCPKGLFIVMFITS